MTDNTTAIAILVSAVMFGFGLGGLAAYLFVIKSLIAKICAMQYQGFRPQSTWQRPKTIPPLSDLPRED